MNIKSALIALTLLLMASVAGAQDHMPPPADSPARAIAVLNPTDGNVAHGVVTFEKVTDGIKFLIHVEGLTPGRHGFHIHEFGDCSAPDAVSAGGHFNPTEMQHGSLINMNRHAGDFGNIVADSTGVAEFEWTDKGMTMTGANSIIGRGVIVHANEDDFKTQPTGNSGPRVACGVIGIAK